MTPQEFETRLQREKDQLMRELIDMDRGRTRMKQSQAAKAKSFEQKKPKPQGWGEFA